jgi:hypothetical protein
MQTTLFSKILVGVLCVFGIFQIAQLFTGKSFVTPTETDAHPITATTAPITTSYSNEEADPTFVLPELAKTYMKDKFSLESQGMEWVKRNYGMEAIFKQNGRTYEVEFDHKGNWIETEMEDVPAVEIPTLIIEAAKAVYPTARISEYEIELTAKGTFYEVEMTTETGEVELYFDNKGKRAKNENEDK